MGNSSSSSQKLPQSYQNMSPAQQQVMWQQYQTQTQQLNQELSTLASRHTGELSNIQKIRNDLKSQYTMMSPFNTSNSLDTLTHTLPYAQPMNQQPLQPTAVQPVYVSPSSSATPAGSGAVPPPAVPAVAPVSTCLSTANGGRCMLTLQAPAGSGSTCKLVGQSDGNVVVYNSANAPIWATGTNGKGIAPYYLTLQANGNLAWTDSTGTVLWQTNTSGQGVAPYTTSIAANCNVQVSDSQSKVLWQSNAYSQ
jgi:hypothetical protein